MKTVLVGCLILIGACLSRQDKTPVMQLPSAVVIPAIVVRSTDNLLRIDNGVWFYKKQQFCGTIQNFFPSGKLHSSGTFYKGKEEGLVSTYYENGNKDSKRYYHLGEKDSVNTGWWPNGNLRFEYHFSNGNYEGEFKEWYASGKPYKNIIYKMGEEQSGKGWRENGKLYMNFVMKDKRIYGLVNPNLCYSLKNEKGEYIRSTSDTVSKAN